jgi:hypothetical protein
MVAICVLWGWRRYVGVLVLIFKGVLRPMEGAGAIRADLVFNRDTLSYHGPEVLFAVRAPKTTWRRARQQYSRVDGELEVCYPEAVFGHLDAYSGLLDLTSHLFRKGGMPSPRRWVSIVMFSLREASEAAGQSASFGPSARFHY